MGERVRKHKISKWRKRGELSEQESVRVFIFLRFVFLGCGYCLRVMVIHNYKEGQLLH